MLGERVGLIAKQDITANEVSSRTLYRTHVRAALCACLSVATTQGVVLEICHFPLRDVRMRASPTTHTHLQTCPAA